ncbi:MAG: hypothetical protein C1943_14405 [Halochromatium sp.]|nr:hypothetical protein [Halochromatium sp.]
MTHFIAEVSSNHHRDLARCVDFYKIASYELLWDDGPSSTGRWRSGTFSGTGRGNGCGRRGRLRRASGCRLSSSCG